MTHPSHLTTGGLALALIAACAGSSKTKEPVVSTSGGKTAVSEAGTTVAKRGKSLVRVVNAIPGERTVDITTDDRTVFYDVGYRTVTPYTEIGDNVVKFRLLGGGPDSVWADNTETLMNGTRYTIVALPGKDGGGRLTVLTDDVVPAQGKARLRVVNAAPILTEVNVKFAGQKEPVFKQIGYGAAAGFHELDPVKAVIVFDRVDPAGTVLRTPRLGLEAGRSYTIVLSGAAAGALKSIMVTDAIRTYAVR
jgi:uncharacterized protein DUF4397